MLRTGKAEPGRREAGQHVDLWMTLPQTDLLALEQSISLPRHGSWLVGDNMTHAGDSFQATAALEPWQQVCLLGPASSPRAVLKGREVSDHTQFEALAARRPP